MLRSRKAQAAILGVCLAVVAAAEIAVMAAKPGWGVTFLAPSSSVTPPVTPSPVLPGDLAQTAGAQHLMAEAAASAQPVNNIIPTPAFPVASPGSPFPSLVPTNILLPTITWLPFPTITPTLWPTAAMYPFATPTQTPVPPTPTPTPIPPPPIISRAEWGAEAPAGSYRFHEPTRIMLHHDGVVFEDNAAERLRAIQRYAVRSHGWVDIPYHYLIDRVGNIYEGRPPLAVGDTATAYDPTGHVLITVLGDYNVQEVDARQLEAIITLATWLSASYGIPPQNIAGHRDYAVTSCPGAHLYAYLSSGYIIEAVAQRLPEMP